MAHGIAALKFVGTVSLGLLTGLSFSLSTVTVPTLLTLPSAQAATKALRSLATSAGVQLHALSGVAASAFFVAFVASPRTAHHPYLLYTSLLVLAGRVATLDAVAPYLLGEAEPTRNPAQPPTAPRINMEASYEVLGSTGSASAGSTGSLSGSDHGDADDTAGVNGEEVRASVDDFLKRQIVRTVTSGLAFAMAVVGLWGDGARTVIPVVQTQTYVVG